MLAWLLIGCTGWSFGVAPGVLAAQQAVALSHHNSPPVTAQAAARAALFPYWEAAALASRRRPAPPAPTAATLLDEVGILNRPVAAAQARGWEAELAHGAPARRAAQLHLWLGEWALAHSQQPALARRHLAETRRLAPVPDPLSGLAAYDRALTFFYQGAYQDSADAFRALTGAGRAAAPGPLTGYDARAAADWLRRAEACVGYHAARARLGVPEPPQLDPLCGAASLAACLRALRLPSDRKALLAACRVTGEGSTLEDVLAAGRRLGVTERPLTADEAGLQALPKPAVAYVEHDHFVAVVRADGRGVSYLCSDCGPWPGGRVDLTWRQWRALDPGLFVAVSRPGSATDRRVARALGVPAVAVGRTVPGPLPTPPAAVRLSARGDLSKLRLNLRLAAPPSLLGHVTRYVSSGNVTCGQKPSSIPCPCLTKCPEDHGTPPADPVNLATGEEEYAPGADLVVYNPHGPQVVWRRTYNSLRPTGAGYYPGDATYEDDDFGVGWTQDYNVGVYDPTGGTGAGLSSPKYLFFPNGARLAFVAPSAPTSTNRSVQCIVPLGTPALITWNFASGSAAGTFTIQFKSRAKWTTGFINTSSDPSTNQPINCYSLGAITDRNGHSVTFSYTRAADNWNLLSGVQGEAGPLLTVQRAGNGSVSSVTDVVGGRSVLYNVVGVKTVDPVNSLNPYYQELEHVSQVVPSGTQSAADRYAYGYQNIANGDGPEAMPFLSAISEPSPDGGTHPGGGPSGMSTAGIQYQANTGYVTRIVDANGNAHAYTQADGTDTQVTYADAQGHTLYSYTATFNAGMAEVMRTRGDGQVMFTADYPSGAPDSTSPYSVTDGRGQRWYYTWDRFDNLMQVVSPSGVTTNLTWNFPSGDPVGYEYGPVNTESTSASGPFALGELAQVQEISNQPYPNDPATPKQPATFSYYEPSGNVQQITTPGPDSEAEYSQPTTATYYFAYDSYGNVLTATGPGNSTAHSITTTYNYSSDSGNSSLGIPSASQTPSSLGLPMTVTDGAGHVTHFRYDARGNLLTAYDALGNESDFAYNLDDQMTTATAPATYQTGSGRSSSQFTYVYTGGPVHQATAYDEGGNAVRRATFTYGPVGEMLSATDMAGNSLGALTYDGLYRPLTVADGGGNVTNYAYDPGSGGLSRVTYPGAASGPGGAYDTITYSGYDGNGDPSQVTDGRGLTTTYQYNGPGGALSSVASSGSNSVPGNTVNFYFDSFDRVVGVSNGTVEEDYGYDDLDDVTTVTTHNGSVPFTLLYSHYGDGSRSALSYSANYGSYTGLCNYSYDAAGRMTGMNTQGGPASWTYLDNDWLSTQTLPNGVTTTYGYDPAGELTDQTTRNGSGGVLSDLAVRAQGGYDGAGNLRSVTASGTAIAPGTTTYAYDYQDRMTSETGSRGGAFGTAGYDGAGNLGAANVDNQNAGDAYDGDGNPVAYGGAALSFDADDKMIGLAAASSGITVPDFSFEAASAGSNYAYNPTGSPWAFSGQSGVTGNDSLFTSGNPDAPQGNQVAFVQNNGTIGQPIGGFQAGSSYVLALDAAQRGNYNGLNTQSVQVRLDNQPVGTITPSGTAYQPYSVSFQAPSSGTHTLSLAGLNPQGGDNTAFLDAVSLTHVFSPPPAVAAAGFETPSVGSGGGAYQYGPSGSAWTFNGAGLVGPGSAFGNPAAPEQSQAAFVQGNGSLSQSLSGFQAGTSYTLQVQAAQRNYNGQPGGVSHQTVQVRLDGQPVGTVTPSDTAYRPYSVSFQAPSSGTHTLAFQGAPADGYDDTAFLDAVSLAPAASFASPLSAGYGPDGLRAWKQGAGSPTYFVYDGADPVLETDGGGNVTALNTFGPNGLLMRSAGGANTLYAFDERGNVAQRLDGSGSVLSSDLYGAYGRKASGNPGGDPFGFGGQAGYYTDAETGLCLLGQRYYDPQAGRFLNRDPLGYAGGMDLYAYTGDNPVNFMDPMGLSRWSDARDWYMNGMGGFSQFVDTYATGGSVGDFGTTVGEADAGCAALSDEVWAGSKVVGNVALLFVPGGEEARGAEVGVDLAENAGRDALGDAGRGCNLCLAAGTPVWMSDGSQRPIEQVQAGDQVMSRDPATGQDAVKTVTATVSRPAPALVTLSLSDPSTGKTESLACTPEHPLYVQGKGWVEAGDLGVGTSIVTRAGPPLAVKSVDWQRDETGGKPFTVYNLTVEGDHTYFAGQLDGGVWAHNNCLIDPRVLQHEFKHAPDFGVTGNWNKANADLFQQAIQNHIANAPQQIVGTFRGTIPVTHYFDPATGLWAAVDGSNTFRAGWKLYPSQVQDLLGNGNVL